MPVGGPGVRLPMYGAAVAAVPDVRRTAAACTSFLRVAADAEWTAPVPELDFTVAGVIAPLDAWDGHVPTLPTQPT